MVGEQSQLISWVYKVTLIPLADENGVSFIFLDDHTMYPCFLIDDRTTIKKFKDSWPALKEACRYRLVERPNEKGTTEVLALPFPGNIVNGISRGRMVYPCFICDDDTNRDVFEKAWGEIKILRNALREAQGTSGRPSIMFEISRLQNSGLTYLEISKKIDGHILALLYRIAQKLLLLKWADARGLTRETDKGLQKIFSDLCIEEKELDNICDDLGLIKGKGRASIDEVLENLLDGQIIEEGLLQFTRINKYADRINTQLAAHRKREKAGREKIPWIGLPKFDLLDGPEIEAIKLLEELPKRVRQVSR